MLDLHAGEYFRNTGAQKLEIIEGGTVSLFSRVLFSSIATKITIIEHLASLFTLKRVWGIKIIALLLSTFKWDNHNGHGALTLYLTRAIYAAKWSTQQTWAEDSVSPRDEDFGPRQRRATIRTINVNSQVPKQCQADLQWFSPKFFAPIIYNFTLAACQSGSMSNVFFVGSSCKWQHILKQCLTWHAECWSICKQSCNGTAHGWLSRCL